MSYTLADVRAAIRNRLDDADYEDEFLTRAINYAQWQITNKHQLSILEASQDLSVLAGEYSEPLPADFHEYLNLLVKTPTDYRGDLTEKYMNYDDFINTYIDPSINPVSRPNMWSEYGRSIVFATPADQNYTLKLNYLKKAPTLVNDSDVPTIPEEYQELLILGAFMRIVKREDDYDVRDNERVDYQDLLNDFLQTYGRKKRPGGMRKMRVN